MARKTVPIVGAFGGATHTFNTAVLTDGRSLHPLQRLGLVAHSGWPNMGTPRLAGVDTAPPAGGPALGGPPLLDTSITAALRTHTMV